MPDVFENNGFDAQGANIPNEPQVEASVSPAAEAPQAAIQGPVVPTEQNGVPETEPRKRHRRTKAEMQAAREAEEQTYPVTQAIAPVPSAMEKPAVPVSEELLTETRRIPLMEAIYRMGLELSCPKTNRQTDVSGRNWNYRNVEDILLAIKPLREKYGVFITFHPRVECIGNLIYVVVKATARNLLGESFSTEAYAREDYHRDGNWAAQVTGSCESYAKKYALQDLLMIDNSALEPVVDPDTTSHNAPRSLERTDVETQAQDDRDAVAMLPALHRGVGPWMNIVRKAAGWTKSKEEFESIIRANFRINEDDLIILLSTIGRQQQ